MMQFKLIQSLKLWISCSGIDTQKRKGNDARLGTTEINLKISKLRLTYFYRSY